MKAPRCTVIVRSRNAERDIGHALAALFSQDFKDFELLVVDSGSTDRTLDIVAEYPHRLTRIEPSSYVPGPVLNSAIASSRSPLAVFLNSDCMPLTPGSLGALVAAFEDETVVAAFARQVARPEARAWVRREYLECFPPEGRAPAWIELSLPFAAMRRSAWEQMPFWDESWGSEDTAWGKRARDRGWTVRYVPEALVMHSHDYTLRQLYGRRFIEGEADAILYGGVDRPVRLAARAAKNVLRDVVADVREGDLADLALAPARRAVDAWGYWRGARHGARRRAAGDTDVRTGQKVVLDRHPSGK
jgi:rhamnosyltransferase